MGQDFYVSFIPLPAIYINLENKEITTNNLFNNLVGVDCLTFLEFEKIFEELGNVSDFPKNIFEGNTQLELNSGQKVNVQFHSNWASETELVIIVQELKPDLRFILKYPDFKNILSDISVGIIIKSNDNPEAIYISQYLINKIGYSAQEINEKSWKYFTYEDDIAKQETVIRDSEEQNLTSYYLEKRVVSKNGKVFWVLEYNRNFQFNGENFQLVILRDISSEKEVETELQRAKHLVEDAERLKSAFLDNMPHEIRTPLHAITGFTSLLSDSDLTHEERLEYVKFIQDSSNDILNLMDNIIEIAKLETNQVKPKKEKCYLNSIFDKLLNDLETKQYLLEKTHLIAKVVKGNPDPLFMIYSDPERLYQICSHLLNNALKFTEKGEIEFGYHAPKNGRIEFYVKDTGVGINEDEQDIIFRKFGKSGNINTNKNRGTGLGLTLSKKLVELLNGEIFVKSVQGQGSIFFFYIPIENEQKITISKPSVSGETNWSAKTILIAEDTESNYFFIEAFLERTKVNLIWAQDGEEAIRLFKENRVDLILMDIMMPEKDGFDATREIKEIDPNIPIVAQTALALPDDEEKCYKAGCDYVLVKPINSEDLIATIKRFIL